MPESENIRTILQQEIAKKEKELKELRAALTDLDAAIKAASNACAVAISAKSSSIAPQAREAAKKERAAIPQSPVIPTGEELAATNTPPTPPPDAPQQTTAKVEDQQTQPKPARTIPPPAAGITHPWPTHGGKYSGMKVWKAIQDLITENRAPMPIEEIVHALQEGGAHLGDNPMRTVTAAIGYMNDKIFHVTKSGGRTVVSVLRPSGY